MKKQTISLALLPVVFLSLLLAVTTRAQSFGEITGVVTDASGAVVAGAEVTITSLATNQTRTVTTNEAGSYRVPFLSPGLYDVKAEKASFKTAARKSYTLQVGDVARIDFALEVGEVTQTIEVSGGTPLIARESTAIGTVVENKRIVELPLNGRNYLQLIALSPNVSAEQGAGGFQTGRQGGDRTQQSFSVAGQRLEFNRYTLDGIENTDVNFNTFIIRPSIEALQEFKVQSGIYSAEFGRATSQVNVVTKSGANEFHGSAFEFLRNDVLDAKEWRNAGRKNPFRRNQFGYTFSGRAIRDRLFFLSNAEFLRDRQTFQRVANVPTEKIRNGDFSAAGRVIYDPATRVFNAAGALVSVQPFANNMIPRSRINPIALKLLEFYPAATVAGDSVLRNFVRNAGRGVNQNQYTQRVDFIESTKSNWFGRYSWGDETFGQATNFPTQNGRTETNVRQLVVSNTRTFGANLVNEFRFGWSNFRNEEISFFANQRDVAKELGIIGATTDIKEAWGSPEIFLANGLTSFGQDANGPFVNRNHIFQWVDNVSLTRGNHSFRFGGDMRRDHYNQFGNTFLRPRFTFTGFASADPANAGTTGHSFADLLLGEVQTAVRALGLADLKFRAVSFATYFEDTWKVTPKLTLNLGLRYENTPPYTDAGGDKLMNLFFKGPGILDPNNVPILTRPGSGNFYEGMLFRFDDNIPIQRGDQFLGRRLIRRDNKDFAPRLGIAYSPTDKWTIRTGFGIFYVQDSGNPRFDMGRNLAGRSNFIADPLRPNSPLGDPWQQERTSGRCTGFTGVCQSLPTIFANYSDRSTPYVLQYILNVQRQLTRNVALEVGYLGNGGRKLERITNINIPVLRTGPSDTRTQLQRRPWPVYGNIQEMGNLVNSNYHGLSVKLQQQFSKGLTYLVGFTWSKAIDNGSAIRTNPGDDYLLPPNPYNLSAERGLSQFHTGRRLVTSVLYELPNPFGDNSAVAKAIFSGWQAGSILTFSDGTPFSIGGIGDRASNGIAQRPDAIGNPHPSKQTPDLFWSAAAFNTTNPDLQFRHGTAGRNTLIGPAFRNWDASLNRNFRIVEGHTLQFRWEVFNAANHPNWLAPSNDITNPATFGRVTSARTMRQMQFALKYLF